MSALLRRLAAAYGVAAEYRDVWGNDHRVDDDTLRALLGAMRVDAGSEPRIAEALREFAHARCRQGLAPMTVVRSNVRPWRVPVQLEVGVRARPLVLHVLCESGGRRQQDVVVPASAGLRTDDVRGESRVAFGIDIDGDLPDGYHTLELVSAGTSAVARGTLAVAPATCYRPQALAPGNRRWGAAVQVYGLRSGRNWGIGDFTDLAAFVERWGGEGADVVGVNPLHALFPTRPAQASPYSPSSRMFVNIVYLDVESIDEFRHCPKAREMVASSEFQARVAALRTASLVDYEGVTVAKLQVLELVYAQARADTREAARSRWKEFDAFKAAGGQALRHYALFEALQEHFVASDPSTWGWPAWPASYRDPDGPAVMAFAQRYAERVDFHAWLQWQADQQRERVAVHAHECGLGIGVCGDLAVSIDRGGADAWTRQTLYAMGASVGAPPDAFSVNGQDWGLPPPIPRALQDSAFAPFIATLRANMRHCGALRIDHVMGLMRLYWVPAGATPSQGTYVNYPFEDLLGIVALESHRERCLVIGEDLGTVPGEVRAALAANDIMSYRVLLFERDAAGGFNPPAAYPEQSLAAASTHDLPTLAGYWEGHDIAVRARHGQLAADADVAAQMVERARDRGRLLQALAREDLLPAGVPVEGERVPRLTPALAAALQRYLARTPSALLMVQVEDAFGVREQANLPGTTVEHPNWQRKLPVTVDARAVDRRLRGLATRLTAERPRVPRTLRGRRRRASSGPSVPLPVAAIPRATYRVQLHREFTFAHVTELVPYFAALGVSHVYCSPYLRARAGSRHGYDIVDPRSLNPEIGTRDDFERMVETLARHGMSHICDVVPNHIAIMGDDNSWWMDVLENGPASEYAGYFDIDWMAQDRDLAGKVLVPVLGATYGEVLERGEIALAFESDRGGFAVRYFQHRFPLDPQSCGEVLVLALEHARGSLSAAAADELERVARMLKRLPGRDEEAPERRSARRRDMNELKRRLASLVAAQPAVSRAIAATVTRINGTPGDPSTFEALHVLLEAQAFRLAHWRTASDQINYRRFFDINELAALRIENDDVFDATHDFVVGLAAQRMVGGLRIDHPDGLYDPARYFSRLQRRIREATAAKSGDAPAGTYVVAEKITAPHERLPEAWAVHGTTGYRFGDVLNGLYVDARAKGRIERAWRAFAGDEAHTFEEAAYRGRRAVMEGALSSQLAMLALHALRIARADRHTRDLTLNSLRSAIIEIVARFPVYRTYVDDHGASAQDRRYVAWAVGRARERSRIGDPQVFAFVHALMLGERPPGATGAAAESCRRFAMHVQQFTAPVAAKGVEDTAFYTFLRLVSLNEVGGDPDHFGTTVRGFHGASADRAATWPHTMLATSTHDNKRSEDVRARINVISEMPAAWRLAVRRWSRMNRSRKREVDGVAAPSRNDEYLLYQTLIGSFPPGDASAAEVDAYRERIERYSVKAAREAKVRTSWLAVNAPYEDAVTGFVGALLRTHAANPFLADLREQSAVYAWYGMLNSLSMALLKAASPGVPDIYQGNEMLDWSLVDPDNRRPVDFDVRRAALDGLAALAQAPAGPQRVRPLLEAPFDGQAKLWLLARGLALRREHPELYALGAYRPLTASGTHAAHVVAFARTRGHEGVMAVAGRLFAGLGVPVGRFPVGSAWGDTVVPLPSAGSGVHATNVLTGESLVLGASGVRVADACRDFPCALLYFHKTGTYPVFR